jgi:hypothetical protein
MCGVFNRTKTYARICRISVVKQTLQHGERSPLDGVEVSSKFVGFNVDSDAHF